MSATDKPITSISHIPNDIYLDIVKGYHAKKMQISRDLDIQCQNEMDKAQDFYKSIFSKFQALAPCIEICKTENSTGVLTEDEWFKKIPETNKKIIEFFLDCLKQKNYSFTYEFKTQMTKDPTSYTIYPKYIYSSWKELRIKF